MSKDFLTNEIFRRVDPQGRTMSEYLKEEFPELDVYSGLQDESLLARVRDLNIASNSARDFYRGSKERMNPFTIFDFIRIGIKGDKGKP